MRVVSYYRDVDDRSKYHFLDWIEKIGEALPLELGDAKLVKLSGLNYNIEDDEYDIAYCPIFYFPNKRPNCFVYAFLSDYRGYEDRVKDWIEKVKPDLLCMLQQLPSDLIDFAGKHGCRVELLPWFVVNRHEENQDERNIHVMCSGCIDENYPFRKKIFNHLSSDKKHNVVLSCSGEFGRYRLSNDEYRSAIRRTRYYASGGIFDSLMPPKYFEVANYGCCLLSPILPYMERCGFIHNDTYISIESTDDIDKWIDTDACIKIGKAAQEMVQEKHSVKTRARQIIDLYNELNRSSQ